jgi:hypothetical protein
MTRQAIKAELQVALTEWGVDQRTVHALEALTCIPFD